MSSSSVNHISQPCIYGHFVSSTTERKSRLMKWLSKLFKGGGSGNRRQQPQFLGDENMVWRAPARSMDDNSRTNKEKEELDRAIALSLAEDLKRPKGYRWRTDQDEDLARSLQDNSNSSSYPPKYAPSYAPWEYNPNSYRKCSGCNKDIVSGNYLGCMGTFFHPECFLCRACGVPITEYEGTIHIISHASRK